MLGQYRSIRIIRYFFALFIILSAIPLFYSPANCLQKKEPHQVDINALVGETQVQPPNEADRLNIVWWIPLEFWKGVFASDSSISEADKVAYLEAIRDYSVISICQADIGAFGSFDFYPEEKVRQGMYVSVTDSAGAAQEVTVIADLPSELEVILGVFKPILKAAMGNLGANMHFFVLPDRNHPDARLIDPYRLGRLSVSLTQSEGKVVSCGIEFPLNSLFVPRKCPNGKEAHVSWNYCPWTGQKLRE
ncbi:MAG: hypothetical protein HRF51_04765 [bacterium]|jgi:hypothetical protein